MALLKLGAQDGRQALLLVSRNEWPTGFCGTRNLTKKCSEIVLGKQPAHM